MNYKIIQKEQQAYIEILPGEDILNSEAKTLDLVSLCGENEIGSLMIHGQVLVDDFYDLHTRLAGDILQKLDNYLIHAVFIIPAEKTSQGRFSEMVLEANRGSQFHFTDNREKAEEWLLKQQQISLFNKTGL